MVRSLADLYTQLNGITGFTGKVAYRAFPEGKCPALPFIVYLTTYTHTFAASNRVCVPIQHINIELYTANKDETKEALVETCLGANDLVWDKVETYIDAEKCYQIIYNIEI